MDKSVPRQSLVMPNSDPWDRFVHPYLTLMSDSYILEQDRSFRIFYVNFIIFKSFEV